MFTHHSFNSIIPAWTNATHTDELPYVFGQTLNSALGFTDDEKNMTRKIMKYWSNFAKTGYVWAVNTFKTKKTTRLKMTTINTTYISTIIRFWLFSL